MRSLALIVAVAGTVTTLAQAPALDGTWTITSVSTNNRQFDGGGLVLIFEGTTYAQAVNGEINERGTIRVDASRIPIAIDFVITQGEARNMTQLGIIEVSGNTMRLHLSRPGGAERPADFSPRPENFLIIATKN